MKLICDGLDLADAVLKVIKATATKTTKIDEIYNTLKVKYGNNEN